MGASRKAALTAIGADVGICLAKFTAFAFTRSSGMLSEALHSLVDAGNGSLLILGLHRAERPADEAHPFGYGKEIYFWTLLVALFIFSIGGGLSILEGILRIRHPQPITHPLWSYITLGVAAAFEGYSLHVGRREFRKKEGASASWRAIKASKDPTTFTVIFEDTAALIGLAIALVATVLDRAFGWLLADGLASVLIGVVLVLVAILLISESRALLVGESADADTLRRIRQLAEDEPGVDRAGYPMTMFFGPGEVLLTMNVRFAPSLSRDEIEHTIDNIEGAVRTQFKQVKHIYLEAESLKSSTYKFQAEDVPEPNAAAQAQAETRS